jgi:hypothetical protein
LKILISGAFSAGKTTTKFKLIEALRQLNIGRFIGVDEVARRCPLPLNRQQTSEATSWLICSQICSELEASSDAGSHQICDRGIPDIWSHYLDGTFSNNTGGELSSEMASLAKMWAKSYDLVLFCPVDERIEIATDGLRVLENSYRTQMETLVLRAFDELNIRHLELPKDIDGRIDTAVRYIESALGSHLR